VGADVTHATMSGGGAGPTEDVDEVLKDVEPMDEPLAWTMARRRARRSRGGQAARVLTYGEPAAHACVEPQGEVSLDINSEVMGAFEALRAMGGDSPVAPQSRPPREAARGT
jgi:hypothetical protein